MQNEYWAGSVHKKVTLAKLKYAAKALEPGLVVTKRILHCWPGTITHSFGFTGLNKKLMLGLGSHYLGFLLF